MYHVFFRIKEQNRKKMKKTSVLSVPSRSIGRFYQETIADEDNFRSGPDNSFSQKKEIGS